MNYDIMEREKHGLGREMCNSRSLPLNTFPCQIGFSLATHDITNFTNITTFTLYKILKACIISVNTQIMKWRNKDPVSKKFAVTQKLPPKIICMDNFKAIFKLSDFCRLNWLQKIYKMLCCCSSTSNEETKTSILFRLYTFLK